MKKVLLLSFNLLIVMVVACQSIKHSSDKSIRKPGDEIDGMVITTGAAHLPPLWAFCSPPLENDGIMSADCQVPQLTSLAIGHTFSLADPVLQTLDWSALTWELSVDGQSVDLKAFGTYDFVVPDLAPHPSPVRETFWQVKAWDVILTNPTPGAHTLHGIAYSETDTHTWTVNFTVGSSLAP